MIARKRNDWLGRRVDTLKERASQDSSGRDVIFISDQAHRVPDLYAVIERANTANTPGAIYADLSAIMKAKSADEQVEHICRTIVAYAIRMRSVHTAWRCTLPAVIKQHAKYAGIGTKYYVDDMRLFCEEAIALTWPEVAA